jgi:hypothetical protein
VQDNSSSSTESDKDSKAESSSEKDGGASKALSPKRPRTQPLPDWGKPGAFPVVPPALGERNKQNIDW